MGEKTNLKLFVNVNNNKIKYSNIYDITLVYLIFNLFNIETDVPENIALSRILYLRVG